MYFFPLYNLVLNACVFNHWKIKFGINRIGFYRFNFLETSNFEVSLDSTTKIYLIWIAEIRSSLKWSHRNIIVWTWYMFPYIHIRSSFFIYISNCFRNIPYRMIYMFWTYLLLCLPIQCNRISTSTCWFNSLNYWLFW